MSKEIWNQSCIISPSLICLDLCNLEQQVRLVEESGIRMLHVDILDGHFSPSMPLGLETVKQLRKKTDLEFEAHVMTANPSTLLMNCWNAVFRRLYSTLRQRTMWTGF